MTFSSKIYLEIAGSRFVGRCKRERSIGDYPRGLRQLRSGPIKAGIRMRAQSDLRETIDIGDRKVMIEGSFKACRSVAGSNPIRRLHVNRKPAALDCSYEVAVEVACINECDFIGTIKG